MKSNVNMSRIIAPSLLSADFLNLGEELKMIDKSKALWVHCDIMDGHFVPNLTFGFPILKQIRKATKKIMDVHLMITNAEIFLKEYIDTGADVITLHYEAVTHLHRAVQIIRESGIKAGVSLNPHTPVSVLEEIMPHIDMVLLMSVNPGYGGQKFIEESYEKIRKLDDMRSQLNPSCLIQVDGGVNRNNANKLFASGANVLVAGNAVFGANNPIEEIEVLLKE